MGGWVHERRGICGNGIGQDWLEGRDFLIRQIPHGSLGVPKQKQMTQTGHHHDDYEIYVI